MPHMQASVWEQNASLSDEQLAAVEVVASVCGARPLPARLRGGGGAQPSPSLDASGAPLSPRSPRQGSGDGSPEATAATAAPAAAAAAATAAAGGEGTERAESAALAGSFAGTSFEDVSLASAAEFYRWLSELETARNSETEGKFRRHAQTLQSHLDACDRLLAQVRVWMVECGCMGVGRGGARGGCAGAAGAGGFGAALRRRTPGRVFPGCPAHLPHPLRPRWMRRWACWAGCRNNTARLRSARARCTVSARRWWRSGSGWSSWRRPSVPSWRTLMSWSMWRRRWARVAGVRGRAGGWRWLWVACVWVWW